MNESSDDDVEKPNMFVQQHSFRHLKIVPIGNVRICYFSAFLSSAAFSVVIPSLWPYVESLGGSKSDIGYPVALFSLGSIIGSAFLGRLANAWSFKQALLLSMLLSLLATTVYSQIATLQWSANASLILLCACQFVSGLSAGRTAVVLAYVAEVTQGEQQVQAIANTELVIALSFLMGPAIGAAFALVDVRYDALRVDGTTLPGYFGALVSALGAVGVVLLFETLPQEKHYVGSNIDASRTPRLARQRNALLLLLIVAQFFLDSCLSVYETISVPIMQQYYDFHVLETSLTWAGIGALSAASIVGVKAISARTRPHRMLLTFAGLVVGCGLLTYVHVGSSTPANAHLPLYRFFIGTALVCIH
jgi:MFS family permease